jgi:hypothetical protein
MGQEARLGGPLGGTLGGALGLRPAPVAATTPVVEVLLVGGGGSAGNGFYANGGGGGGQVVEATLALPIGAYPVVVGLYGRWGNYTPDRPVGGATKLAGLAAIGGACGGPFATNPPISQDGAGWNSGGQGKSASWTSQQRSLGGFEGGAQFDDGTNRGGGGGGGSGGPGGNADASNGGAPGAGKISSITGVPVEYGKGGRGGHTSGSAPTASLPGEGGGGQAPNSFNPRPPCEGQGGILIARYLTGTQTWTGGAATTVGPWTLHTFTADGTFTRTS